MNLLILTSCTGEKHRQTEQQLTLDDFRRGSAHVRAHEQEISEQLVPAEQLYSGAQHVRLMRGVEALRAALPARTGDPPIEIALLILSAGYGLVPGDRLLAPYEATFRGMGLAAARAWSEELGIPAALQQALSQPYDLGLILLGDEYLRVSGIDRLSQVGGPTLLFRGASHVGGLPALEQLHTVALGTDDTRRFSCGFVGLKGEVAGRLLAALADDPASYVNFVYQPDESVRALASRRWPDRADSPPASAMRPAPEPPIEIADAWWEQSRARAIRFFVPEWDDLVDPNFDFVADSHSDGVPSRSNDMYAHQLLSAPAYDGLLVSRMGAERNAPKRTLINQLGVHRLLRVPTEFPIMGDCGAFGYLRDEVPPFESDEILDYYTRLGFDLGVSIDHLIVPGFEDQRQFRYDLTIANAEAFINEHRKRGLSWTPIGAVQGWDPASYADAARQYVAMGYTYIALGSLVRSTTEDILRVAHAVQQVIPASVRVHLFGIARLVATRAFVEVGIHSVDSASPLRKAWLDADENYLSPTGWYSAIRVPQAAKSLKFKQQRAEDPTAFARIQELETSCLTGLRRYAATRGPVPAELVDALVEYDQAGSTGSRKGLRTRILRTLEDRPWEQCDCAICQQGGIEVVIFRGNNRNRRRGFHNTQLFYTLLGQIMAGERIPWVEQLTMARLLEQSADSVDQLSLFAADD